MNVRVMIVAPGSYGEHRAGYALRWLALSEGLSAFETVYFAIENHASHMPESLSAPESALEDSVARSALAKALFMVQPDVVVVTELRVAAYIATIRRVSKAAIVLDLHNVESKLKKQLRQVAFARGDVPHYSESDVRRVRRLEQWAVERADMIWVCSSVDQASLRALYPLSSRAIVIPNAVHVPKTMAAKDFVMDAAFVGALDYAPNAEAGRFVVRQIAPAMKAGSGNLVLAGRNPMGQLRREAESAGVQVIDEFQSFADVTRGSVLIVPLFEGSGTRFKILEAMAEGVPVISTDVGIEGIEARADRHFVRAHTGEEFAKQVDRFARDRTLVRAIQGAAFALVTQSYSIESLRPRLEKAVVQLLSVRLTSRGTDESHHR